jgi:type I restriction enzyme, R subunit
MGSIGKSEKVTQERVIKLLSEQLGYRYLGDWTARANNRQVEEALLGQWLEGRGHTKEQINRALDLLGKEANNPSRSLYENNKAVYSLLRYGVPVKVSVSENTETVWLIDWKNPQANDFGVAEEVTLEGPRKRRPDLVLYVNGLALGVMELKRSSVGLEEGIRQLISNQQEAFHAWFFSTAQVLFAGNDTQGLRYGTIETPEKMYLGWKEDEEENQLYKLDKYVLKMCEKGRFLELARDFVLFDGGVKKLPRVHQYMGIKAAQQRVSRGEGGVIWHTQGSGKSIVMVLLAKWILEHMASARVLIITDRDELDKQIARVFRDSGEDIYQTQSGADLMAQLGQAKPRLLCSLIHKFGKKGADSFNAFIEELRAQPSVAVGDLVIFVDECHRTQSGRLHKIMKALLPKAVFIGFTGTPLLKQDKQTSLEVFGRYIHTYKFGEAVRDAVVLDLVYEARDIAQVLGPEAKVDQWFDAKTKGLNDWQKAALREQWGTMQRVLSSRSRMDRVVEDIVMDFGVKDRLMGGRGNAMLVAASIYDACRYFQLFGVTDLKGRCAVVTSYDPKAQDITKEDTGANTDTEKALMYEVYTALLKDVTAKPGKSKTESYEDSVKEQFIKEPAKMKLLIVVDKLLTGFDAPSCSYLYIDKSMQDHGLFQAICRTNRLDGEEKRFGYIVDYKDLFKKVQGAISVYTSELEDGGEESPQVQMQDRLEKGRERLEAAREAVALLCEPVQPPKGELEFIHYFCGNTEVASDLEAHEPQRVALYKAVAELVRAYAALADSLEEAGYTGAEVKALEGEVDHAVKLRQLVRQASGEVLDMKAYEADMRFLIDTFVKAEDARRISGFGDVGLLELLVEGGVQAAIESLSPQVQSNKKAVAETIANNVRSRILREHIHDPAFYDQMSALLKQVLEDLKAKQISYEGFLQKMAQLAKQVKEGKGDDTPAALQRSPGLRAIYNNLKAGAQGQGQQGQGQQGQGQQGQGQQGQGQQDKWVELAQAIDTKLRDEAADNWRGVLAKEQDVKRLIYEVVQDKDLVEQLFSVVKAQAEY